MGAAILIGSAIVFHGLVLSVALIVIADRLGGRAAPLSSTSTAWTRRPSGRSHECRGSSQNSPVPDTSRSCRELATGYTRQSTAMDRLATTGSNAPSGWVA
ncbi:hypothetical protein CIW48_19275 [Methylobacterium sp. P1-11]|nr:hypothetical protein CIW48_19275 [Methylobacterium sp. P1-11]